MIKILLILFIPIVGFAQGLKPDVFSIPNLPYLKIQDSMDSICYYNLRSYSLDKLFYNQTGYQWDVSDKDAKSILIDDIDTTSEDYQKIIENAKGNLANWLSKIFLYNSRDKIIDSLEFIFFESEKDWLDGRLIVNNTINFRYPAFSDKTGIIFFDYRNKSKHIYKSRNLRSIGKNNSETFYIVDAGGFIDNFPVKKNDIIKLDSSGFSNITDLINTKYLSKIQGVNKNIKENLSEYIEYFDGSNIIFINNIDDGQLIRYKLERIINYPKRFTIIGDSIISIEEYLTSDISILINNKYSAILEKKTIRDQCFDFYILNENGSSIYLKLSDLISFESNTPNIGKGCSGTIIYLDSDYAIIKLKGLFLIPNTELIIVDLKKHKIIAAPKLIYKDNFPL